MSKSDFKVGIIGGGIGGLSLALALRDYEVNVSVFERANEFCGYGAGIQLSSNGVKVLRNLRLEDEISNLSLIPQRILVKAGDSGAFISQIPLGENARKRYSANFYLTHRNDLIEVLADHAKLRGVKCYTGSEAVLMDDFNRRSLIVSGGEKFKFDIIVGADGVYSGTRDYLFEKRTKVQFMEQVCYRATVPIKKVDEYFTRPEIKMYLSSGRHLICYPIPSKSIVNLIFCKDENRWMDMTKRVSVEREEIENSFSTFYGIDSLLKNIEGAQKWGLFGIKGKLNWGYKNVLLLGDACHPMLPYLAQGANQALEDAFALARLIGLRQNTNLNSYNTAYRKLRNKRVKRVIKAAKKNSWIFHLARGPVRACLYIILRFGGKRFPNLLLSRFDWLYNYEP